jgi:hypothetical protein
MKMKPRVERGVFLWTLAGALVTFSILIATCIPAKAQSYPRIEYLGTEVSDQILNTYFVHCGGTDYPIITIAVTFYSQDSGIDNDVIVDIHDACERKIYLYGAIELVLVVAAIAEAPEPVELQYLYLPMVTR